MLPVSTFVIDPIPGVGTNPPNPQPFTNLLEARDRAEKKLSDLPPNSVINVLNNWDSGGLHGLEHGRYTEEDNVRTDGRTGNTMAQEVSHTLGLWWHTFTDGGPYPRKDGRVDDNDIGIDMTGPTPKIVGGAATPVFDIMSYHTPPPSNWVSSFTYLELMKALNGGLLP